MSTRRALISKDDLDRMATVCAAHGVVFRGRIDPSGAFDFTLAPKSEAVLASNGDLDDRIAKGEGF